MLEMPKPGTFIGNWQNIFTKHLSVRRALKEMQGYISFTSMILMKRGNTGFLLTAINGTLGKISGTIIGVRAVIWGPLPGIPPSPTEPSPAGLSASSSPEKSAPLPLLTNIRACITKGRGLAEGSAAWPPKTDPTRAQRLHPNLDRQPGDIAALEAKLDNSGTHVSGEVPAPERSRDGWNHFRTGMPWRRGTLPPVLKAIGPCGFREKAGFLCRCLAALNMFL